MQRVFYALASWPARALRAVRSHWASLTGEQLTALTLAGVTLAPTIADIATDPGLVSVAGLVGPPLLMFVGRAPWLTTLVLGTVSGASLTSGGYNGAVIAACFAAGLLAGRGERTQLLTLLGLLAAGLVVLALLGKPYFLASASVGTWATLSILVGAVWSHAYKRLAKEAAAHAAAMRSQRNLIARELHDTLARANTFMVLRAQQAAAELDEGPAGQASVHQALEDIIRAGHQSVSDLRTMLRVLREDDPQGLQAPTIMPELPTALEDARATLKAAGIRATISNSVDINQLSPTVAGALAYILNESVANMIKYAAKDAQCTIQLELEDDRAELLVINPLGDRPKKSSATSSGLGLIGIKERASTLGGIARATQNGHQWLLHVTIPYEQKEHHGQQVH